MVCHSAFGITTRSGLSSCSSMMRQSAGRLARLHLPGAQAQHRGAVLALVPGLQVAFDHGRVGGRLLDGDARDVMARGHVARAFVGALGQCDATRQAVHRRRERALLARAGDRKRAAEAQAELQVVAEALAPAFRTRIHLAGPDRVDALGITGGQAGQFAQLVLRRGGRHAGAGAQQGQARCRQPAVRWRSLRHLNGAAA